MKLLELPARSSSPWLRRQRHPATACQWALARACVHALNRSQGRLGGRTAGDRIMVAPLPDCRPRSRARTADWSSENGAAIVGVVMLDHGEAPASMTAAALDRKLWCHGSTAVVSNIQVPKDVFGVPSAPCPMIEPVAWRACLCVRLKGTVLECVR
jgi:hypothetical protein